MDFSDINLTPQKKAAPTDPKQVFNSLTLRGSINNIWEPQDKAVGEWSNKREQSDVAIEMATGGGKTLVGLLVGQASVNELRKPGLYVCPTIQLAEQTRKLALETGLEAASYLDGRWEDDTVFDEARGLCITTYAAVFNSRSRIARGARPGVIVFDDAHVAGDEVRKQFSLRISRMHSAFMPILDLVRPHFRGAHEAAALEAIGRNVPVSPMFLPQFETRSVATHLRHLLQKHGVDETGAETWFAWGHIGSRLEACAVLLDSHAIEIVPPVPPVRSVWCMGSGIRRIYLTATLPSAAEFARTFGVRDLPIIRPEGKLGAAQRLFIFPQGDTDNDQRREVKQLLAQQKACIIVPARSEAGVWLDEDTAMFQRDDRHDEIERFAAADPPEKLILAARYHGIDLPGDSCRVLVLDGLPRGTTILDRFMTEGLQAESLRASQTAVRVIQAVGRIFRSNTDHGAVALCGPALQRWIRQPQNRALFPPLLQRQLALALTLRKEVIDIGRATYDQLLNGVLGGEKSWDELYSRHIDSYDVEPLPQVPTWVLDFAAREHEAYEALWDGNATKAATDFSALAAEAEAQDPELAAWYHHWAGSAYQENGQVEFATIEYLKAANQKGVLGRPAIDAEGVLRSKSAPTPSAQARAIVREWTKDRARILGRVRQISDQLAGASPKPTVAEVALAELGSLLGLLSIRPDTRAEGKTGPDVSWRPPDGKGVLGLEAKTGKSRESEYRKKDDVGQAHDHAGWAEQEYPNDDFSLIWVGPTLPVSRESHPPQGLRVVEPGAFAELAERLAKLYEALSAGSVEETEVTAERFLRALGLRWPECWRSLPSTLATDLQQPQADQAGT